MNLDFIALKYDAVTAKSKLNGWIISHLIRIVIAIISGIYAIKGFQKKKSITTEKYKVKDKYSKLTFKILILIPITFILFGTDQLILPQKQINDHITEYSKIIVSRRGKFSTSSSNEFLGYKYYTQKGYEFALSKTYIEENKIIISQSYIFQNISNVKTINKEYSNELMSGLNGACLYIAIGLFATSIISLLLLKFNSTLSENGFQNIVLSNAFLTIIFFYLLFIYN